MKNSNWTFWVIGIGSLIFMIFILWINYIHANQLEASDKGVFGDMFGASNAFFTGLSFTGVIIAILLQKNELKLQRQELELTREEMKLTREEFVTQNSTLKIQQFESTLFQMLNLLQITTSNSIYSYADTDYKGKQIFDRVYRDILRSVDTLVKPINAAELSSSGTYTLFIQREKSKITHNQMLEIFSNIYEEYKFILNHQFSTFITIIKFIDANSVKSKKIYFDVLTSQLSSTEMVLLFYYISLNMDSDLKRVVIDNEIFKKLDLKLFPNDGIALWE